MVRIRQDLASGGLLDNSGKAIGWLNRLKLSSSEAEHDFGVHVLGGSVGRTYIRE